MIRNMGIPDDETVIDALKFANRSLRDQLDERDAELRKLRHTNVDLLSSATDAKKRMAERLEELARLRASVAERSDSGDRMNYAESVARLMRDHNRMLANLTATQARCTALLDESRANRRIDNAPPGELHVLGHVSHERRLQDQKWGPLDEETLTMADGTGDDELTEAANDARSRCNAAFAAGEGTWADILEEEVAEALAEQDPKRLRAELIQVAAVAVKWCEAIDLRGSR
jgi:hypothetical protein